MKLLPGSARIAIIGLTLLSASLSWGTTNSCPSSTSSTISRTLTSGPTYSGVQVPGTGTSTNGALTNANAGNGAGLGCTAVNLTFNNFTVASSGTNESSLPNASVEGTAGATYIAQTTADLLLFSTLQGAGTGADGSAQDGTLNYKVDQSESMTAATAFTVADSKTSILSVTLSVNDITIASADGSGTASFYVCEGGTFTGGGGGVNAPTGCSSGGTLVKDANVALIQEANQTITLALPLHPATIDVEQIFTLSSSAATTDETGFLTFDDQFQESPEPSTFILLSTSLAAVAVLKHRKRTQRK
jgi:hypothetical protein